MDFLTNTVLDSLQHSQCGQPFPLSAKTFLLLKARLWSKMLDLRNPDEHLGSQRGKCKETKASPFPSSGISGGIRKDVGHTNKQSKMGLVQTLKNQQIR